MVSTNVVGPIETFMTEDHVSIDILLEAAEHDDGTFGLSLYDQFRQALLRHIAMEEKVLLPYARGKRGGNALPIARALRQDHGTIAKLLTRAPTGESVATLRELLAKHDALEEGPNGLYSICDDLAGDEAYEVVEQLRRLPAVPLAKFYDGPITIDSADGPRSSPTSPPSTGRP